MDVMWWFRLRKGHADLSTALNCGHIQVRLPDPLLTPLTGLTHCTNCILEEMARSSSGSEDEAPEAFSFNASPVAIRSK